MLLVPEIRCSGLPSTGLVVRFSGEERLSAPYVFSVTLHLEPGVARDFEPQSVIGQSATLVLTPDTGEPPVKYAGVLRSARFLNEQPGGSSLLVELVPQMWLLSATRHSQVFVNKSIPQIIQSILTASGFRASGFQFQLLTQYPPLPHVYQHEESHLQFIQRLIEDAGLYYYFEQSDEGERVVFADTHLFHSPLSDEALTFLERGETGDSFNLPPIGSLGPPLGWDGDLDQLSSVSDSPIPSHPAWGAAGTGAVSAQEVHQLAELFEARISKVVVDDHSHQHPTLKIHGEKALGRGEPGIHRVFGDWEAPEAVMGRARVIAEERESRQRRFEGSGSYFPLRPGYLLKIEDHPVLRGRESLLLTRLCHESQAGAAGGEYACRFEAIPSQTQYREKPCTDRARVPGVLSALVDGPVESDYAQLDGQGRYRVKLVRDEARLPGGQASMPVRLQQPLAGNPEGMHFPLRKNAETLLGFLGGDPNHPVVAGFVPDAPNPSPVTQGNHTLNRLISGGRNHLELEDAKNKQWVNWYSPTQESFIHMGEPKPRAGFHWVGATRACAFHEFKGDHTIEVGGNKKEHVVKMVSERYDTSQHTHAKGKQKSDVAGDVTEEYGVQQTTTVTGPQTLKAGATTKSYASQRKDVTKKVVELFGPQSTEAKAVTNTLGELDEKASPVIQSYGPVTGTWASLDLNVPGGAVIICPDWTMKVTHRVDLQSNRSEVGSNIMKTIQSLVKINVVVLNAIGVSAASYSVVAKVIKGISAEVVGVKAEAAGITFSHKASGKDTYASDTAIAGIIIWRGMLLKIN